MKKYGNIIFTFLLLLLLPLLLLQGTAAGEGVRQGLELSYRTVLPALFPAMVVCGMIGEMVEYLPIPPCYTLWFTSHLCGFPLGIRTLTRATHRGLLSHPQAERLSACCVNASPAFLILYVGKNVLGSARLGILLCVGQLLLSLGLATMLGALKNGVAIPPEKRPLLSIAAESLSTAAQGGLVLTGYITFFSMLAALCRPLPAFRYFYGFLELTGGIGAIPYNNLLLVAAMVGFSGVSVLLQNASYLLPERLSLRPMIFGKCLYTLLLPPLVLLLNTLSDAGGFLFLGLFLLFLICFDKR